MSQEHSDPCTPEEAGRSRKIWDAGVQTLAGLGWENLQERYNALARDSGNATAWVLARLAAHNGGILLRCAEKPRPESSDGPADLERLALEFFDRAGELPTQDRVHAFLGWVATQRGEASGWSTYTGIAADVVRSGATDERSSSLGGEG